MSGVGIRNRVVLRSSWMGVAASTLLATAVWIGMASEAQAAPPNTMPIWRLQVRFLTANVDDAGTDDSIKVELNGANRTWLDSGRDDHERNSDETFDLRMEGVDTLADIDYFRVEKNASDGWALRQMQLIVNGVPIYVENFPPLWLDNEGGASRVFLNNDYFMRQRSEWINYVVPTRSNIVPVRDMERRVEALVGDSVHGESYTNFNFIGGDHGVEMFTMYTNVWRVDLDLENEKQFPFPDLEFDVDFDLTVLCEGGRLRFAVTNVNTDASWPEDVGGSTNFVGYSLAPRLNDMMKNYTFNRCPTIVLASNGDLYFDRRFPPFEIAEYALLDTLAPIGLHVSTGGETQPGDKAMFQAAVRSTMKQNENAKFSFQLPPEVALIGNVIEVEAGKASHKIEVKLEQQKDGSSSVVFSDVLVADSVARYNLPVVYKAGKDTNRIKTVIQPLDEKTAASVTALEASTWYEFHPDLVVPIVTSAAQSEYIDKQPRKSRSSSHRLPEQTQ